MSKAENEKKRSLARTLYLSGAEMTEISDKIGISRATISRWCKEDSWKALSDNDNIDLVYIVTPAQLHPPMEI